MPALQSCAVLHNDNLVHHLEQSIKGCIWAHSIVESSLRKLEGERDGHKMARSERKRREKGIYILSSHAGPMQDARRLKPKRPKPANCKQEN